MVETGGPIDEMDASLESLVPLWEWYYSRMEAGFPEVAPDALPARARTLGWTANSALEGQAGYAIEPFAHYLVEILRVYDGRAHWILSPSKDLRYVDFRSTVVATPLQERIAAEDIAANLALNLLAGRPDVSRATGMLDRVLRLTSLSGRDPQSPPNRSILSPFLAINRISTLSPLRVPPTAICDGEMAGVDGRVSSGDFVVAPRDSGPDFETSIVEAQSDLAAGLTRIGVTSSGAPVTASDLETDRRQLFFGDKAVLIEPKLFSGRLTSLSVQPIGLAHTEWLRFCNDIEDLASRVGLQFGPPEHFVSLLGSVGLNEDP